MGWPKGKKATPEHLAICRLGGLAIKGIPHTEEHKRNLRGVRKGTPMATVSPSLRQLFWAAGFLEGEGSFIRHQLTERVSSGQMQKEPLERLSSYFGGTIYQENVGARQYQWQVSGALARGVMMTLFSIMSPRRKNQIRAALQGGN